MCINCGCGNPNGGSAPLITDKTFEDAAKAAGQSIDEAKRHVYEYLKKEMESKKQASLKKPPL